MFGSVDLDDLGSLRKRLAGGFGRNGEKELAWMRVHFQNPVSLIEMNVAPASVRAPSISA
ncbi:MAG TPA: hypothetical protein DCP63_09145 [Bacteroidetes bacterium]|nr:hypothetical protein [Bacteroidota bacterium]